MIMKTKFYILNSLSSITVILVVSILFVFQKDAVAKQEIVAIEGMSYNVNASMTDNLQSLYGKRVSLTVVGGKTFSGVVKEVGNHMVHLEKIEGREFYDALIAIESISALEAMFRSYRNDRPTP